ncbi:MAG: CobW family GTP-binding protein [Desulfovibrio sp.]|uniref:CobW family GTP-binding protein n=1 Tax=Desulfovibrio sp. 7SRBS1 TaxID=3378064 RepID=UPI003B425839
MIQRHFLPPGQSEVRIQDIVRLPSVLLAQSAKDSLFKRASGWRGLAPCRGAEAFTCRIAHRPGVYGLAPSNSSTSSPDRLSVDFHVYYFPAPEEPMADTFSLAAGFAMHAPDYRENIREFPLHDDMAELFFVGRLTISMTTDGQATAICMQSEELRRTIALDGIRASGEWIIEPGQPDENLPALSLCRDLYSILCAAFTFCVEEPPVGFADAHTASQERRYRADGTSVLHPYPDCSENSSQTSRHTACSLVWGDRDRLQWAVPSPEWQPGLRLTPPKHTLPDDIPADTAGPANDALCWTAHDMQSLKASGTHTAAFDTRPGLVVLSGFLGAGKTTFLNQFIEYNMARDQFVAVIQNEIGQTGLDATLLEGDDSVVEMDEGCVCCTLAGNLAGAIGKLMERHSPEVIILESTGLANPRNLLSEIDSLSHLVRLDAIVTLVDAEHATDLLESCEISREQILGADALVVNKCDLVSSQELERLRKRLNALNPSAPVLEAMHGHINFGMLFDTLVRESPKSVPLIPQMADVAHAHDHHKHHHDHRHEGFSSLCLPLTEKTDIGALSQALEQCTGKVFRIKGIFLSAEDGEPHVLQFVGGRHDVSPLGVPFADRPFVVLIGQNLQEAELRSIWGDLVANVPTPSAQKEVA